MNMLTVVRCPNCGSLAQRLLSDRLPICHRCPEHQVAQTECAVCDYLMMMCWQNGKVLEAYAPGRPAVESAPARHQSPASDLEPSSTMKEPLALVPLS